MVEVNIARFHTCSNIETFIQRSLLHFLNRHHHSADNVADMNVITSFIAISENSGRLTLCHRFNENGDDSRPASAHLTRTVDIG